MTMTQPNATTAGWYPDPSGQPMQRWWDGYQWTEHVGAQIDPYQKQMLEIARRNELGARRARRVLWTIVWLVVTIFIGVPLVTFAIFTIAAR